jgi:hypothetical protein
MNEVRVSRKDSKHQGFGALEGIKGNKIEKAKRD